MRITSLIKLPFYFFAGTITLIYGIFFAFSLIDQHTPINEATKTCLVTGASSGIGREISIEMIKRGWKVIGVARRTKLLENLQKQCGANRFIPCTCDVSDFDQVHQKSNEIKTKGLKPTLFFLNAGIRLYNRISKKKNNVLLAEYQKTFAVNYFGVIAWIEEWLPFVKKLGGGTFVATASVASIIDPGGASYGPSKAALMNSFRSLHLLHSNDKVAFSTILCGPVNTAMGKGSKNFPFIHEPNDEAQYIIGQIFKGKKQIEPSWFYSNFMRFMHQLPDPFVLKAFSAFVKLWS
ncbi:SDR family NAD(P)-dependent oxidoreductase [Candidatus Dependentiae bacterium]